MAKKKAATKKKAAPARVRRRVPQEVPTEARDEMKAKARAENAASLPKTTSGPAPRHRTATERADEQTAQELRQELRRGVVGGAVQDVSSDDDDLGSSDDIEYFGDDDE